MTHLSEQLKTVQEALESIKRRHELSADELGRVADGTGYKLAINALSIIASMIEEARGMEQGVDERKAIDKIGSAMENYECAHESFCWDDMAHIAFNEIRPYLRTAQPVPQGNAEAFAMGMALQDYRGNGLESLVSCSEFYYVRDRYHPYLPRAKAAIAALQPKEKSE